MARRAGWQAMQVRTQRKKMVLIALLVIAGGLLVYQLLPSQVDASVDDAHADSHALQSTNERAALDPVAVTWPIELNRDLFGTTSRVAPTGPARDEVIRTEARNLIRPQVILHGRPARVMIDGHIVEVGEMFAGFELVEISGRSIVVEKEGVQVRIGF